MLFLCVIYFALTHFNPTNPTQGSVKCPPPSLFIKTIVVFREAAELSHYWDSVSVSYLLDVVVE